MKKFLMFLVLFCVCPLLAQNSVIAYFPHWAQYSQFKPSDVRWHLVTEVRYGYLTPSEQELLFTDDSDKDNFLELVKLARAAKVKITVAVGGLGTEDAMKASYGSKGFAEAAKKFKNEYGIDAFELDGGAIEAGDLPKLLKLAAEIADAGIPASVAIPGTESLASAVSSASLSKIDKFSLWFTDEASTANSQVKPNSNTSEILRTLDAYANAGVPKNKLVPIIPFYGKTFYKASGLGSSHEGAGTGNEGVLQYRDILDKFKSPDSYKVEFDEQSKSEVAVSSEETIVFNGIPSVKALAEAVKSAGYGGVAAFDISGDHKEPIVSLLVTMGQVLRPDVNYKRKK